jgi:hypothetical protein
MSRYHIALAYLAESHRRGRTPFAWTLMQWCANARRRAVAGSQRELFA